MIRFNIFGIPVVVQPFFWLTLVFIGSGVSGDGRTAGSLFALALFVLAGFISILVHELGHALTARRFGARVHIVLQAFGGYAAYSGIAMTRARQFLITAAGPGYQVVLGLLAYAVLFLSHDRLEQPAAFFLDKLALISLFWAIFNLLPILPLDGGRLLEAVLGPRRIHITLWTSIITASLIGLIAITRFHGINKIIIPVFFGMFAWQAWKALPQNRWK